MVANPAASTPGSARTRSSRSWPKTRLRSSLYAAALEVDRERGDPRRGVARVDLQKVVQAAHEERGGHDHQERQRDLDDDQRLAQPRLLAHHAAAGRLQRGRDPAPDRAHRRREAREQRGGHGDGGRERHDPPVGRGADDRDAVRGGEHVDEQAGAPRRDDQAAHAAHRGEHRGLRHQQPRQPQPGSRRAPAAAPARARAPRRGRSAGWRRWRRRSAARPPRPPSGSASDWFISERSSAWPWLPSTTRTFALTNCALVSAEARWKPVSCTSVWRMRAE